MIITYLQLITSWLSSGFYFGIILLALIGAVMVAATREDAFTAADRQSKWVWVALLAGSSLAIITRFPFLAWIGIVITGVFWFDVRLQIRDILRGNSSW